MPSIQMYNGDSLREKHEIISNGQVSRLAPYLPGKNLVKAVQLAQILKRPLLLKGEPGCGKSRLAEAVAFELFGNSYKKFYFEWHVKSTSKAQDGLFTINYLQRLSDANTKEGGKDVNITLAKDASGYYEDKGNYIELGELGKAFQLTQAIGSMQVLSPPVVLIDEIDKADIDFPNDLLLELDRMEFMIPEAKDKNGETITIKANPDFRPLIFITSNDEKPLPPAFLRRCLFHYIDFKEIPLYDIVKTNFADLPQTLADSSVDFFKKWREKIEKTGTSNKNITTSELLDWVKIIDYYYAEDHEIPAFSEDQLPPHYSTLLKDPESIKIFASPAITKPYEPAATV